MITEAIHERLAGDAILSAMLNTYRGEPAVFTVDPAPGDAALPYIITAGAVSQGARDTKTTLGREIVRDVRCYTAASGSSVVVEEMAERVRQLLHREPLVIANFVWILAECSGPIQADEQDAYGRIVSVRLLVEEI